MVDLTAVEAESFVSTAILFRGGERTAADRVDLHGYDVWVLRVERSRDADVHDVVQRIAENGKCWCRRTVDKGLSAVEIRASLGSSEGQCWRTAGRQCHEIEFIVDVDANPGILLEVPREITTLSIARRNLHGVLESIVVVFLNLGLFGPVQLREDFDILIVENGTQRHLL